jgi:hypothetical protein
MMGWVVTALAEGKLLGSGAPDGGSRSVRNGCWTTKQDQVGESNSLPLASSETMSVCYQHLAQKSTRHSPVCALCGM